MAATVFALHGYVARARAFNIPYDIFVIRISHPLRSRAYAFSLFPGPLYYVDRGVQN